MICGRVEGTQAQVTVTLRVAGQPDFQIEFVVDTGFEGALTLPSAAVSALGLPYLTELTANLADNSTIRTDVHVATVVWDGATRDVAVLVLDGRPLLGTALLAGHRLQIEFADGGTVSIDEL